MNTMETLLTHVCYVNSTRLSLGYVMPREMTLGIGLLGYQTSNDMKMSP